jgi:TIR domain
MAKENRQRRTYREIFIDKLEELSGDEQKLIGNITLQKNLGWDEERYDRIKQQLVEENAIIVGRGKGGAVALAKTKGTKALNVFISYSHFDETVKTELVKHLEPLVRQNLIEAWHFRKLKAGNEWDRVISKEMENSQLILLLVSIDFINSKYCYETELEAALELHQKQKARVIPVILRSCLWNRTSFAKLQALPRDAKPISSWQDRDEALTNVADGVRQVAEEWLNIKSG